MFKYWTEFFVIWVVVFSALAYFIPAPFAALQPGIVPGLGIIMFGMGMTLLPADFIRVGRMPRAVLCGLTGQFIIMPLLAYVLVKIFRLPPELAMGFIILGSCPGGTASNVVAYLAGADVALSVTMTAFSTLAAILLTPQLIALLGAQYLPVDRFALFMSVVKIVLVPVGAGMTTRLWLGTRSRKFLDVFPALSVLVIVLIVACIVALSRERLPEALGLVGLIVCLHNILGLALGYALATALRLPKQFRRTIAIEVGMQNSGLGVALAQAHFTSALTALPASLFSVIHNLTGSALATWWRRHIDDMPSDQPDHDNQA